MKLTAALLGCCIATSAIPSAYADALLFPVLTRSPAVATIISVANKDPSGVLNVNYFSKGTNISAPCTDGGVRQIANHGRANDIVSFDASGNFQSAAGGGPLFNDPATMAPYSGGFAGGSGTARMVLIVDDGDDDSSNSDPFSTEDLYGEALLLEIVGGAAWGYRAYNSADNSGPAGPLFGGGTDFLGEVIEPGSNEVGVGVTLLPPNEWTTRFFVTPVAGLGTAESQRDCENCSARIFISPDKEGLKAGVFDRDTMERANAPFAQAFAVNSAPANALNVVCTGAVDLTSLLPQAIANQINNQGGWGYVQIRQGNSGNQEQGAVVIKLEFNLVNGSATTMISPDAGTTFTGTVNSAVWLRNLFNQGGVSGF